MKNFIVFIILLISIPGYLFSQTNPSLFDLSTGSYSFTSWANTSAAGTYPSNMIFQRVSGSTDPTLTTEMTTDYTAAYSLTSGARVNGLNANGFSFVNSGSTAGYLGTAILGLNTTGRQDIKVSFTAGTVALGTPTSRLYKIRLQYKIGTSGTWTDVPGPIEYSPGTAGSSQVFGPTTLPAECNNQPTLYVRWKYYFESGSGGRPELRVDEISVTSSPATSTQNFTTYRTELIDGTNGFSATSEKFNTTRAQINGFVSWDKDYIYLAYSGSTPGGGLAANDRAIHFYIDTDPKPVATQGTGTTAGETWRWTPTLPFSANYHYAFKTLDNSETKRVYSGTAWGNATFFTENFKNTGTNYWEVRIKRSDIGNPKQINVIGYVMEDWDATPAITGGLPSNLFTDNTNPSPIAFTSNFLNISFIDKMTPNSAFTLNNHGWSLRLKATSGAVADTSAMAGMFANATNLYDAGIDHPKSPAAPANYINVYFPHSTWTSLLGPNYERDFKALADLSATTSTWDFTVNSDIVGNIVLNAASFEDIPSNYSISLKDSSNGQITNLRTSSYSYSNGVEATSRNFTLTIGVTLSNPTISVAPSSLDFGSVKTNATKTLSVVIRNTGDQPLNITNMAVSGTGYSYLFNNTTATLNTNDTIIRVIKFAPTTANTFPGTFTISSNDPANGSLVVNLTGIGVLATPALTIYGDSLAFGSVIVGTSSQKSFVISNTGGDAVDLVVSGISISGNGSSPFSYLGTTPVTIAFGDSASFSFNFLPPAVAYYGGTITITSNAPGSPRSFVVGGSGTTSSLSNSFPAGWNLMSIPLNPVSNLTSDILTGLQFYYLYAYTGGNYVSSLTMNPASGYWLGIEAGHTINLNGTPVTGVQTKPLTGGWNLIASPFTNATSKADLRIIKAGNPTPMTIEEAVALNLVQRPIYKYTTSTASYDTTYSLSPWNGNWFFTQDTTLSIRYGLPSEGNRTKEPKTIETETTVNNWFATISTSMNGVTDRFLAFGTNEAATDGFDNKFDFAKAPISPAAVAIESYFSQTDWSPFTSRYASNIQSPYSVNPGKSWSFKSMAKSSGLLKISWTDILSQIPQDIRDNYKFIISGPGLSPTNMLLTTSFEFNAVAGNLYTFVINSTPVGIEDDLMNLNFNLGQNYPNPFNPSTTINYGIKETGFVTLKIYDILGNEVVTLVNEVKQPGRYEVRFEASNLPSGTYFYKLVQGKNSEIKKLMLLK
ncbi:hypothetical protein MASR1M107_09120 [Ignavibacteriales bacterium]